MKTKLIQILLGAVGSVIAAVINHYAGSPIPVTEATTAVGALAALIQRT